MASEKVELSKKVDELSTQVEQFSKNVTDFIKNTGKNSETILTLIELFKQHGLKVRDIEGEITGINESVDERFDELSKKYKQVLELVESNSRHIERLFNKIKGNGSVGGVKSEPKNIALKDLENEFKTVSKTLEDFTNPHLTNVKNSYGPVFPGSLELSSKHTPDFKALSEILNTLLVISKANSDNIKAVKESKGEDVVEKEVDTDFKEDEEPTARMMELVSILPNVVQKDNLVNDSFTDRSKIFLFTRTHIGKYPIGYGDGQFPTMGGDSIQFAVSKNGNIFSLDGYGTNQTNDNGWKGFRVQVFDSDGNFLRKFPSEYTMYDKYKCIQGYPPRIHIFEDELFISCRGTNYWTQILVYNLDGKFLYRFGGPKNNSSYNVQCYDFNITNSGDILMYCRQREGDSSLSTYIYKRTQNYYVQRPLERKYKIYYRSEVDKQLEGLESKKVSSVTFPLCTYQYRSLYNGLQPHKVYNDNNNEICENLLTDTIYFQKPQSVKKAVKAVEEYFNEPVSKSDFQDLQSECLFGYIEGRFASRKLNWKKCNKNRLCRGYFLGGNVLSGVQIIEGDELVLDITQD
jgi:hypothetical protein